MYQHLNKYKIITDAVERKKIHEAVFRTFYKGNNFFDFLFAILHTDPLLKRVYYNKKEFAPKVVYFL